MAPATLGMASSAPPPGTPAAARILVWPLIVFLGGVSLAQWAGVSEHRRAQEVQREEVRIDLEGISGALSRELFGALHLTEGIAGLVAVEGEISDETFHRLAAELFRRTDLIRNVVIAPDNVVRAVHPEAKNERSIGLDYSRNPEQWPSVRRMMEDRRMVVAGPVALVQGGVGVIGRTPIYVSDDQGRNRYWGLTSTVLEFERLLSRTPFEEASSRIDIALRGADGLGERGTVFWGDPRVFDEGPVVLSVPLPSGSWQLAGAPLGGWAPYRPFSSANFLIGCLLSALLSGLLLRFLQADAGRRREVAQRRVTEAALLSSHRQLERAHEVLEDRVAERTEELRSARDAAESADRLKSAFLATMSHELRTPLNSIIGFSGILLQGLAGPLNAEQTKQLGMVQGSAKHLLALINDVLVLSKIEAGHLNVITETFDVRESVERVMATVRPQAEAKGLELRCELDLQVESLESDRRRVEQVLLNLLSNALKFTERGHVLLEVTLGPNQMLFAVTDTGPGIAREDQSKLFLPFSQVDTGLDRKHEGTGLGLSICRRLVEHLGGTIGVVSDQGQGSTFCFELPLHPVAHERVLRAPGDGRDEPH